MNDGQSWMSRDEITTTPSILQKKKKQTLLHFLNCIIKNVMLTDILRVIVNKLY